VAHGGQLTADQAVVLDDLLDQFSVMRRYHGLTPGEISRMDAEERLVADQDAYDELIIKAYLVGLGDHPLVQGRIATLRGQGAVEVLRRADAGLDAGVNPPLSTQDLREEDAITEELRARHLGEKNSSEVYRTLKRKGIISGTRQAFDKRCVRDDLLEASEDDPLADCMMKVLLEHGALSRTALSGQLGRHIPSEQMTRALHRMERSGLIVIEQRASGGRGRPLVVVGFSKEIAKKFPPVIHNP
jgi:hypothetical protein